MCSSDLVIAVEPEGAPKMTKSIEAGKPVTLPSSKTIADGLMNLRPGDITFAHVRQFVDEVVTVGDDSIAATVAWLFKNARLVVEPSGAVTTAAIANRQGHVDLSKGPVVAVVSGGNVAPEAFARDLGASVGSSHARRAQSRSTTGTRAPRGGCPGSRRTSSARTAERWPAPCARCVTSGRGSCQTRRRPPIRHAWRLRPGSHETAGGLPRVVECRNDAVELLFVDGLQDVAHLRAGLHTQFNQMTAQQEDRKSTRLNSSH